MQNDAIIARDAAKEELGRLEKHLYEERKQREIELQQMKKEAEEKRIQQEKIMTRNVDNLFFILYVMHLFSVALHVCKNYFNLTTGNRNFSKQGALMLH